MPTVFPTRVGVNRVWGKQAEACNRLPHARGGEPELGFEKADDLKSSPRAWG